MAGKKPTPVKPAPPSTQRNGSAAPGSKSRPKHASEEATAASAKKKPASAKKKRDKPEAQEGGKRKKQQAPADAGTPAKRKKGEGPEPKPRKEATPAKKQQPSGKPEKPATPSKKRQQPAGKPATPTKKHRPAGKPATPAKKQQPSGKAQKPAGKPATPAKKKQPAGKPATPVTKQQSAGKAEKPTPKKQQSPGRSEKSTPKKQQQSPGKARKSSAAAAATTPTEKKPAKLEKPTPTKRKRSDDEATKEVRSPKRAPADGEARASTPVNKKRKNQKAAAADMGVCNFPMARVRQLMRIEDATIRASSEAVFLINKASELFLGKLAEDAYRNAMKDHKKSIIYDNLSKVVCSQKGLKFLSDFVPQRVVAEHALKSMAADFVPQSCSRTCFEVDGGQQLVTNDARLL